MVLDQMSQYKLLTQQEVEAGLSSRSCLTGTHCCRAHFVFVLPLPYSKSETTFLPFTVELTVGPEASTYQACAPSQIELLITLLN